MVILIDFGRVTANVFIIHCFPQNASNGDTIPGLTIPATIINRFHAIPQQAIFTFDLKKKKNSTNFDLKSEMLI